MKNQNQLIEKYPKFFDYLKERQGLIMPIQFGFECGDGWYPIISTLMSNIDNHLHCPELIHVSQLNL